MDRRDWLILLLAYQGADTPALDPVRVQKGLFLFAMEQDGLGPGEKYAFGPHHYGPYSSDARRDLDGLVFDGLAREEPVPGYTWSRYHLTHEGMTHARGLLKVAPRDAARRLFDIKQQITSVSFNELLRGVYAGYPDYAKNSVFAR